MKLQTEKIESVRTHVSATTDQDYRLTALAQVDSKGKVTSLTGGTLTAPTGEVRANFDAYTRPSLNISFVDEVDSRSALLDMIENFITDVYSRTFNLQVQL